MEYFINEHAENDGQQQIREDHVQHIARAAVHDEKHIVPRPQHAMKGKHKACDKIGADGDDIRNDEGKHRILVLCPVKIVVAIISRKAHHRVKEQIRADKKQTVAHLPHLFTGGTGNDDIADHGHQNGHHHPPDISGQGVSVFHAEQQTNQNDRHQQN